MKISSDPDKYTYSWRYVELAKYVPSLNRIIREKKDDQAVLLDVDHVYKYANKFSNTGIYTSVWHFNSKDISSSLRLGSLYFDIDNEDINLSWEECKKFVALMRQSTCGYTANL